MHCHLRPVAPLALVAEDRAQGLELAVPVEALLGQRTMGDVVPDLVVHLTRGRVKRVGFGLFLLARDALLQRQCPGVVDDGL